MSQASTAVRQRRVVSLADVSPLNPKFMPVKWIVVSPGNALDLCQVSGVTRYFEENSYDAVHLILDDLPDIQFSHKDIFQFLFDHTDVIHFKCFSDCM